jgi:hypothetical protein
MRLRYFFSSIGCATVVRATQSASHSHDSISCIQPSSSAGETPNRENPSLPSFLLQASSLRGANYLKPCLLSRINARPSLYWSPEMKQNVPAIATRQKQRSSLQNPGQHFGREIDCRWWLIEGVAKHGFCTTLPVIRHLIVPCPSCSGPPSTTVLARVLSTFFTRGWLHNRSHASTRREGFSPWWWVG